MDLIFAIILLLLAICGVVVRKTYYYIPVRELKRQAERHDPLAVRLYPAVAYGSSLRALLWLFIALTSAGGFVLLARTAPIWLSLLTVISLLWAAFSWLPASRITKVGAHLTAFVSPSIVRILNYLHPVLSRAASVAERRYSAPIHTGMFERDDLLRMIEQQQSQVDSRLSAEELEIAKRALSFSDYKVSDITIPRKEIKTVSPDETIGPILIDELHKTDQSFVLVREGSKSPIVGSLAIEQLGLSSKGRVREVMNPTVYYVHENDSLSEALHAFIVTNHPLFIVVNSFEEYVGVVTIENILQQLLGHVPGDEFDQYADIAAVASRHPRVKKTKKSAETPVKTDEKVVE